MLIPLNRKSAFLTDILKKKYFNAQLSIHAAGIHSTSQSQPNWVNASSVAF